MLYCAQCTKLMDEDVEICPNCGNIDPDFQDGQHIDTPFGETVYERLKRINEQVGKQQTNAEYTPTQDILTQNSVQTSRDTKNILEDTDDTFDRTFNEITKREPGSPIPILEARPSDGLFVSMMLLCIFISPIGLILALKHLTSPARPFRTMGLIMLCVSILCLPFALVIIGAMMFYVYLAAIPVLL